MSATQAAEPFVPLPLTFDAPSDDRVPIRIAAPALDDLPYIRRGWMESHHRAKEHYRRPFTAGYKERTYRVIDRLIADQSTELLCAYNDAGRIIGWICWTPGRGISTVHYVYTRYDDGQVQWRRRGVMAALVQHANLGPRVAYTHRGEWQRGSAKGHQHWPRPLDEEIAAWAERMGVGVVFQPIKEWLA